MPEKPKALLRSMTGKASAAKAAEGDEPVFYLQPSVEKVAT